MECSNEMFAFFDTFREYLKDGKIDNEEEKLTTKC